MNALHALCIMQGFLPNDLSLINQKTKHIERRHYFIRELVEENRIVVPFVPTNENLADFFTKPLNSNAFFPLRNRIMNVPDARARAARGRGCAT